MTLLSLKHYLPCVRYLTVREVCSLWVWIQRRTENLPKGHLIFSSVLHYHHHHLHHWGSPPLLVAAVPLLLHLHPSVPGQLLVSPS